MILLVFFKALFLHIKKLKYLAIFLRETLYLRSSSPKMRHLNEAQACIAQ